MLEILTNYTPPMTFLDPIIFKLNIQNYVTTAYWIGLMLL